jgi:PPOX class probable F420-dependent enzyme
MQGTRARGGSTMRRMGPEETRAFLMEGTRTGKLATVRADGRPHVTPVWFVLDGDDLIFNTGETSVKARDIRRDERVSLLVDDERFPYAFVLVEGVAKLIDDLAAVRRGAFAIAARYVPADRVTAFGERNGVPGELLVRLTPTRIIAEAEIAG